jgi:hypothetical protein
LAELLLEQLESLWLTEHEEATILTAIARRLVHRSVELGEVIEAEATGTDDPPPPPRRLWPAPPRRQRYP